MPCHTTPPTGWRYWLIALREGEEGNAHPAVRTLASESGMVTWATLVVVFFFVVMAALVINAGAVLQQKMETQNAADAVAYSGTLWHARGLNAMTAANHLVGELAALHVLHHALGAEFLDENANNNKTNDDFWILAANFTITGLPISPITGEYWKALGLSTVAGVSQPSQETAFLVSSFKGFFKRGENPIGSRESTIYMSKLTLKGELAFTYKMWSIGAGLVIAGKIPILKFLDPIGRAIVIGCKFMEAEIKREYKFVTAVEKVAKKLVSTKQKAIVGLMKALWIYEKGVLAGTPLSAVRAASTLGEQNHMKGTLAAQTMPLVKDETSDENRSQLLRATIPWVRRWRHPLQVVFLVGAPVSNMPGWYQQFTAQYAKENCDDFRNNEDKYGFRLYVLKGLDVPSVDKSQEKWNTEEGSGEADSQFCHLGVARREKPPFLTATAFFRQGAPDGLVCYAQAMVYNANPQQAPRAWFGSGGRQPQTGWDTLAWANEVEEWESEWPLFLPWKMPTTPEVKLNWQAKLVPVTNSKLRSALLKLAVQDSASAKVILKRTDPLLGSRKALDTH